MSKSTPAPLDRLVGLLSRRARLLGWSDAAWARRAGLPKETLSRLRSRSNCDLATVAALADAVGASLDVVPARDPEARFPARFDRADEAALLDLLATRPAHADSWRMAGPGFFMAGLAVTLASASDADRPRYLALAEALHAGSTQPDVYATWLAATPWPPSRLFPMLRAPRAA